MANPKRRHSNTRTRLRRSHDHLIVQASGLCPNCKAAIRSHRICKFCGFYKGKQVLTVKVKTKKKEQ
ncbi:MAG: 50S ribosomal protein L32 [Candidatus Omnitrophica bacterium]|nr:50S ribosomal protein L32 [Candidatus Omnitrophota bacterium]